MDLIYRRRDTWKLVGLIYPSLDLLAKLFRLAQTG